MMNSLNTLQAKLKEAKERAEGLQGEEELLGFPRSTFLQLEEAPRILAPYPMLYTVIIVRFTLYVITLYIVLCRRRASSRRTWRFGRPLPSSNRRRRSGCTGR